MESKAAEMAKATEAASASETIGTAPAVQTPINPPPSTQIIQSMTEVAPVGHDSALKPPGVEIPADSGGIGISLSAPTPIENVNISELKEPGQS